MIKIIYTSAFVTMLLIANLNLAAQVTITGPACVVPGTTYEYNINGTWDSASTMKLCLTGGVIADSTDTTVCTPQGSPLKAVIVIWNDVTNGSIDLTSSAGNSTLTINITIPLSAGIIDTLIKTQMIAFDSIPSTINCSTPEGGACSPSYVYQWQRSPDRVSWINIPQAVSQNLAIDSILVQSTYFRRRVTETTSGSIDYSDVASVFVGVSGLKETFAKNDQYCMLNKNFVPSPLERGWGEVLAVSL